MRKTICVACTAAISLAWATGSLAQVQVSSFTQGTAETTGQVGIVSPLTVFNSDPHQETFGSASPSPGVSGVNNSLPEIESLAGSTTPTEMAAATAARGSTIGTFDAGGDSNSFGIVLGAGTYGEASASINKTQQDQNPTNLFAQGSAQSSITGEVVFTIAVPSRYSLSEQAAFDPYATNTLSASDILGSGKSSLSLYQLTTAGEPGNVLFADVHAGTASQFLIDKNGVGILAPGTYVLAAQTNISESFDINYETGGNQGLFASVSASDIANLSVKPVSAPEIDSASATGGLTLLLCGLTIAGHARRSRLRETRAA
jgi:hypothetical protein